MSCEVEQAARAFTEGAMSDCECRREFTVMETHTVSIKLWSDGTHVHRKRACDTMGPFRCAECGRVPGPNLACELQRLLRNAREMGDI